MKVVKVSIGAKVTGGTFTLTGILQGAARTTADIAFDADWATIESAIDTIYA